MNASTQGAASAHFLVKTLALIVVVFGLPMAVGGLYLIALGGSWYYCLSGIALLVAAVWLFNNQVKGVWLCVAVFLLSIAWALWEAGANFWPLVPRLLSLLAISAWALAVAPLMRSAGEEPRYAGAYAVGGAVLAVVFVCFFAGMFSPHDVVQNRVELTPGQVSAATEASGDNWISWAKTGEGARYAPFDQINRDNVANLEVAWIARTGHIADQSENLQDQNTPLYVDGRLFQCGSASQVTALNGTTGERLWQFDPEASSPFWKRCRTLAYFDPGPGDACGARVIVSAIDASMYALKASDGSLCPGFGSNGKVDLTVGLGKVEDGFWVPTTGPFVAGDKILIGSWVADNVMLGEPSGAVRAFDAETGRLLWAWDLGNPDIDTLPPAGETYTRGTPNVWSGMAFDLELNMLYLPLGNATPDYYGRKRREFDDDYNASIVALDLGSGKERWHFNTVNHDIWDFDLPSQPALADIPDGMGGVTPVVVQTTKRGQIFVLNRETGEPVKPVEQRKAPASDGTVEGEYYAETQPYSVGVHAIGGENLSEARMWGATPIDQMLCRILFRSYRYDGDFTTQSVRKSIIYPGNNGGMNWGSSSIDQRRNLLLVADMRMPVVTHLIPREQFESEHPNFQGDAHGELSPQFGLPYAHHITNFMSPLGIPCLEPPWGTVSAVDLVTGELVWQQPAGTARDLTYPKLGIQLGLPFYVGMPALGGVIATGGGLAFHSGTQDYYLRAYDVERGDLLWEGRLPSGAQSTPMTYVGDDGRQYVVTTAGGARYNPRDWADYVVAFALRAE